MYRRRIGWLRNPWCSGFRGSQCDDMMAVGGATEGMRQIPTARSRRHTFTKEERPDMAAATRRREDARVRGNERFGLRATSSKEDVQYYV